jgi:hypothetical protein
MGLWIKNADGTIERTAGGGADGEDGQPGVDGNMWHVGSGAPASTLGEPGDYYLDGTDGWVYVKRTASSWTNLYVNLTGPPGDSGGGDYLPLSGGVVTGDLQVNGQYTAFNGTSGAPTYSFWNDRTVGLRLVNAGVVGLTGDLQVDGTATVGGKIVSVDGHTHNYAASSHTHSYLPLTGGSLTGPLNVQGGNAVLNLRNSTAAARPYMAFYYNGTRTGYIGYPSAASGGSTYLNADSNSLVLSGTKVQVTSALQVDGQIKAKNGSNASPAYSFASNTNTGLTVIGAGPWPSTAIVSVVANGTSAANFGDKGASLPPVYTMTTANRPNVYISSDGGLYRSTTTRDDGQSAFGIAEGIDTADVLERADTATLPPEIETDDDGNILNTAEIEAHDTVQLFDVVTALLLKVKELSAEIKELKGN